MNFHSLEPVRLNANHYFIKIQPSDNWLTWSFQQATDAVQAPLEAWLTSTVGDNYSINFQYDTGWPSWNLILRSEEDLTAFLLRYGDTIAR